VCASGVGGGIADTPSGGGGGGWGGVGARGGRLDPRAAGAPRPAPLFQRVTPSHAPTAADASEMTDVSWLICCVTSASCLSAFESASQTGTQGDRHRGHPRVSHECGSAGASGVCQAPRGRLQSATRTNQCGRRPVRRTCVLSSRRCLLASVARRSSSITDASCSDSRTRSSCACTARACVHTCACMCVCGCMRVCMNACVHVCVRGHRASLVTRNLTRHVLEVNHSLCLKQHHTLILPCRFVRSSRVISAWRRSLSAAARSLSISSRSLWDV
jgi:hypothetical protein